MAKIFLHIPAKKLKAFTVVFFILCGGYSIYLICAAVFTDLKSGSVQITPIKPPGHMDETGDESVTGEAIVDEETFREITRFKKYMDSLKQYNRNMHDSMMQARPGLMDSAEALEQIYWSQKNK